MIRKGDKRLKFLMGGAACALMALPAFAQEAPAGEAAGQKDEILVMARRRAENVQDVPDSVTVFTGQVVEDAGIEELTDVANLTPNFSFFEYFRPGVSFITVRGIPTAQGGEPPVTIVVDGVQVPGLDFVNQSLFDIESIEILKGPQGALYGRGAIGGAILINTRQPTNEFEARGKFTYGNGEDVRVSGAVSGPIVTDRIFFRFSANYINRDGLIVDAGLNEGADFVDELTLRGQIKIQATDDLSFDFRGNWIDGEAGGSVIEIVSDAQFLDYSIFPNRDLKTFDDRTVQEWSGKIDWQAPIGTFTSVSGYQKSESDFTGDADFGPLDIARQDNQVDVEAFNQDIRLTSPDEQAFRWIIGGFYQWRETFNFLLVDSTPTSPILPPGLVLAFSDQADVSNAWAAYGQANYDIMDNLELTVALRYDEDKRESEDRSVVGSFISDTFSAVQPKASLAYNATDDVMFYFSYGRGFRSGGFNALRDAQQNPGVVAREYPKEISDNFEIGAKTTWFNGDLTLNAALFRINFDNQQFFFVDVANVARSILTIQETQINGFEIDMVAQPLAGLTLTAGLGVTDADIEDFNGTGVFDGNRSPQTYNYTTNLSAQYVHPLGAGIELMGRVDYEHRGEIVFSVDNRFEFPATDFVNLKLALQSDQWSIGGFARNLTNEITVSNFGVDAFGPGAHARFRTQPRYYGVEATLRF